MNAFVVLLFCGLVVSLVAYHLAKPQCRQPIKLHECSGLLIFSTRHPPVRCERNVIKSGLFFLFLKKRFCIVIDLQYLCSVFSPKQGKNIGNLKG